MDLWRMEFSGKLLERGFWLYIWDIKEGNRRHLYVGRTGDSSSPNASSPFRRIGQHLDSSVNAKGNALGIQLKGVGIKPESCTFEMTAIGPLFDEQQTMPEHRPLRNKTAALERALADELKRRGYNVLGSHPRPEEPDADIFEQVLAGIRHIFPSVDPSDRLDSRVDVAGSPDIPKRLKTRYCICGCGLETGRKFRPGHDARVKGWLDRVERGTYPGGFDALPETLKPYVKFRGDASQAGEDTSGYRCILAPVKFPGRDDIKLAEIK